MVIQVTTSLMNSCWSKLIADQGRAFFKFDSEEFVFSLMLKFDAFILMLFIKFEFLEW